MVEVTLGLWWVEMGKGSAFGKRKRNADTLGTTFSSMLLLDAKALVLLWPGSAGMTFSP